MKNLIATAGCALVIGLSSTFAQQDSTRDREHARKTKQPNETSRSRYQQTDETHKSNTNGTAQSNTRRDMVIVQPSEVPASLRQTLSDPKYQGWENAIIYHNTKTDEYLVSPRPHRFSSEGKEIGYSMGDDRKGNKSSGYNRPNRSSESINEIERASGNSASDQDNDRDRTNGYGTRQDSTHRKNGRASSYQDRERSGQSGSSYRSDSTQMNNTDSNKSRNMNSDRNRSDSSQNNSATNNSNASNGTTSSNNSYTGNRVEDQNLPTEGMVLMEEQDVPAKLKETLRDSDYSGWERGKLYQNPATGEYILIMGGAESGSDEQRSYRFDKDGKVIKDKMNGRGQE